MEKIFLRNLGTEAREGSKNLEAASNHDKQGDHVQPVRNAHRPRMLADCLHGRTGLGGFEFNDVNLHPVTPANL